jgi:hypothetical protein
MTKKPTVSGSWPVSANWHKTDSSSPMAVSADQGKTWKVQGSDFPAAEGQDRWAVNKVRHDQGHVLSMTQGAENILVRVFLLRFDEEQLREISLPDLPWPCVFGSPVLVFASEDVEFSGNKIDAGEGIEPVAVGPWCRGITGAP